MRKVRNLSEYKKFMHGDFLVVPTQGVRVISFEVNPYGPVAMYWQPRPQVTKKGEEPPERMFIGATDEPDEFHVTVDGPGEVVFEPSSEVWVRHQLVKATNPNPGEGETFTRMERMGIHVDEIGAALHRQAVMNRIVAHRENYARDVYQGRLEKQMADLTATIAKLTAPREEAESEAPAE